MFIKNVFESPEKEIDLSQVTRVKSTYSAIFSIFAISVKEVSDKLIPDNLGILESDYYIMNTGKVFSKNNPHKIIEGSQIIKESNEEGFTDLVLGYVDNKENKWYPEVFIKDFNRVNNFDIIDAYFTEKSEVLFYKKQIFMNQYQSFVSELTNNQAVPLKYGQFKNFFDDVYNFYSFNKSKVNEISDLRSINQELLFLMKRNFNLHDDSPHHEFIITLLMDLGVVDMYGIKNNQMIPLNKLNKMNPQRGTMLFMNFSERFKKTFE